MMLLVVVSSVAWPPQDHTRSCKRRMSIWSVILVNAGRVRARAPSSAMTVCSAREGCSTPVTSQRVCKAPGIPEVLHLPRGARARSAVDW